MRKNFTDNISSKIPAFDKIQDIENLKSFGTYREVRFWVEEKIGASLKVNGWHQLFEKINGLSLAVNKNIEKLTFFLADNRQLRAVGSFSEAKVIISDLLSFPIKARSWNQLEINLKNIVLAFRHCDISDKSALFEKNKIRNFVNSSRLEGIKINDMSASKMTDVLNKYRANR